MVDWWSAVDLPPMLAVLCRSVDGRLIDEELTMAPALGLVFLSNIVAAGVAVCGGVVVVVVAAEVGGAVLAVDDEDDDVDDDDDRQFMLCCLSIIQVEF